MRIPLHGVKYWSNIFGPVHAYLIKQWEIYFSSNVRSYSIMDRSNFWSMQLFHTGTHFKLEEVSFWKGIFPSWHNRLNTNVWGSGKINEAWKEILYLLNYFLNNKYHWQSEKGNFNIVLVRKWGISYLKVASIWIRRSNMLPNECK